MLVDTGAVVLLMSLQDFKKSLYHIRVLQPRLVIQNYSEQVISKYGYFNAFVSYNGTFASVQFYVTDKGTSLLGLGAFRALKIIIEGKTLSCSLSEFSTHPAIAHLKPDELFVPNPGHVEDAVHRCVRRQGVPSVAAGYHRHPCRILQEVTGDLLRLEATGVVGRMRLRSASASRKAKFVT
ncbi:hypothetical protein MTO96_011457 [Rhipicephalus appendiculatus]